MNIDDRKIFDKEYIYLNNLADIVLTKIKNILFFSLAFLLISLIFVNYLNQNIHDEYMWTIEYYEPNPTYNVKKIIKSIDSFERDLGYNRGNYHYDPSHIIFNNFYNFLRQNNEKKVFESKYKLENKIDNKIIEIKYKFFILTVFTNKQLMIEIAINDNKISKDYVKKFKKFYEIEFINQTKEFYSQLIREKNNQLKIDSQNDKIEYLTFNDLNTSNQVDLNLEIINNIITEKYELLKKDIENTQSNIKKEDFKSLFLNSNISSDSILIKKKISLFIVGFISIISSFIIFSALFIYLEYRKKISNK